MGFIKNKRYVIDELGVNSPSAYAIIDNVFIDSNGKAHATFNIQKTREDALEKSPFEQIHVNVNVDKSQPLYSQIYTAAKESNFSDWDDDIIEPEEETKETEVNEEPVTQ